jgi:glycosyltransferase involved in cell wall biosynthesis
VARTLSAFDLCVFPSLWEGTPLTVFETLAMGKPIVSTDADGLVDVLTPDVDAVIVPKRDAGALAEKIVWAIDRPAERARLAAGAREKSVRYDISTFVRKMERLYTLMHEVSRLTHRKGVIESDLSFLT